LLYKFIKLYSEFIKDKFFDKLDIGIRGQKGNFIRWHLDKKVTLFGQKGNY